MMKRITSIKTLAARAAVTLFLAVLTAATAWADEAVTLSVDNDFDEGTAGHWFVNMPATGTNTLTFSNSNITTFKVYDDGGKNGNYSNNCKGTLTLTAPTGYVLQLSGSINTESTDNLTVYDGSTTSDTKLLDAVYTTSWVEKSITATSTGNSMMLYFKSDGSGNYRGLDLTVTLVSTSEEFGITVNSATGGSVAASVGGNSATKAKVNDVVTLTATPPSGYMVSDIIVKDENNIPVAVSGGWYSNNQATFTMPGSAVTVTPSFTNTWTADGGLYVNMPATGTNTLTIPSGVQSFKVYDDGGAGGSTTNGSAGNYSNNCSGYLTLTAPTGYVLQLSGSITTEKSNDNLTVYNGNTTSATKLLDEVSSSKSRTVTTITTVVSSGQSMMLYFKSDRDVNYTGLDLTVTLVLSSPHSININTASGGTVTASVNNQSVTSARIEDAVTLTATPESGYVLSGISVTDGNSNAVDIDWSIWTNTATFTMPGSEVTVTPTFTNAKTADDGLNINMIETGEQTATIPAGVQSFHVDYDYSIIKSATSKLTMTAPEGYLLQLSGTAKLTGTGQAYFRVYDGDNVVNAPILINSSSSGNYSYTGVVSTGNVMTIYCWTSYTNNDRTWDLDVTVNVVNANTSNGVTISNSITNGQVVSDKNTANVNETVTLTATPAEGCVLQSISVTDGNGAISLTPSATDATWGDVSYYTANEFTFKMRSSDATVTATFMSKTDFYVNMPKTDQRDFTIPDGTTSFKVYDNSGKDGSYFTGNNGKLLLTAPEGYVMNVSGYVKLYYSSDDQDYLDIYDGNSTSATSLGRFKDTSGNNNTFTQTSVNTISSTNQMLLHFVTNDYGYAPGGGVYLTVTLVPKEYSITYNGVEGATFSTTYDSYTIESAAITLDTPSKTGYDFSGWYDNSGLTGDAVTTIAAGSTGDVVLWAKWTAIEYNITYNGVEGATFATANPTTYTIESDAITLTNPTKDGYSFAGWTGTGLTEATTTVTIAHGSTGDKSYTATWTASTYAVTVTAGENMTKTSGEASQTVNAGDAMTDVVYTANEGYYFPTDYSVDAVNGVSVTRNSYTQITVSGSPTAAAEITLTAPTAKTKPDAPTTPTAVNCTTADNNDGKLTGVMADMEYKKSDAESWMDGTGSDITGLTPGTYYVRIKATDTTLASDNQELTIAAYVVTTYIVTVTDGTGGGDYEAGASVTIIANDPAAGWQFKEWTGADGLTFTDGSATTATATFTMPSADVTVTATWKKLLTITADSDSKEYDGSTLTKNSYTSEGLLEGDVIESVTISGCQAAVGTSDNVPSAAVIKNGDTNVTANYSITYVNGTLTVTAKQIESESGTIVTQDENGYSVTVDERNGSGAVINGTVLDANGEVSVASLDYDRPLSVPTETDKDVTIGGEPAKLYTTCLPTIPTANANVKYYTLASVSGTTLHFTEVTSPAADTPYLMAVTGSSSVNEDVTASNVTLKKTVTGSTANGYTMMGTQTGLTNSDAKSAASIADNATYILQAGSKWGKVTDKAGVYIPPFRAYITGPKVKTSSARQMNSSFGDDDATGIDSIRTTDADDTERWYDLNGRRIAKPNRKGLYIRNGKVTTTTDLTD